MSIHQRRQILYDDDDIRVVLRNGKSSFTLVTFGDRISLASEMSFFADAVAEKADLHAIGIMAKWPNWYPAKSLHAANAAIRAACKPGEDVIAYGGSMGGYGAIKFSKLLGASHVLSLCPQWSLDRNECGGVDRGWQDYFTEDMRNMGIKQEDVEGRIFILVDNTDATNRWHMSKIAGACPAATVMSVPRVGHHATTVLAGSANLLQLLHACRENDTSSIRTTIRRARNGNWLRTLNVINAARLRHPDWAMRLYLGSAERAPQVVRAGKNLFTSALLHLCKEGRNAEAAAFFRKFRYVPGGTVPTLRACSLLAQATGGRVVVKTAHGTTLSYDMVMNVLRHGLSGDAAQNQPVSLTIFGRFAALSVQMGAVQWYLRVDKDGDLKIPDDTADAMPFLFELVDQPSGRFAIQANGLFASAEPKGRVICNRSQVNAWESFSFDITEGGVPM